MDKGFIYLSRELFDRDSWLSEPFNRNQAWIDLIQLASWKESRFYIRGNRVDIKRGQLGYSILTLSKRWKWSQGKVVRFLNELEIDEQIVQQKTRLTTLIYIVNYDKYQAKQRTEDITDGEQTENRRRTDGEQTETLKEVNSVKSLKKTTPLNPPRGNGHIEFLELFPIEFQISELFRNEWNTWTQNCKEKRKAIKLTQATKQSNFLAKYPVDTAIAILDTSTTMGYTGLFAPKHKKETDEERSARQLQELKEEYGQA